MEITATSRQIESYTFQGYEAFAAATVLYLSIAADAALPNAPARSAHPHPGLDRPRQRLNGAMGAFDVNVIVRNLPYLWEGLQLSFLLAALAIAGGIFFGAILAVLRMSSITPRGVVRGSAT